MNTTSVSVTSDTRSLLNALSATFTNNSTTVLGELLQNARRAGSTKIEITATDEELKIADDGRGIDDLSILLSIAKTGWDTEIQAMESPYGLGFISCLFAAEHITVSSKGKRASASTADLLDLKPMNVEPDANGASTVITLTRHKFGDLDNIAKRLATLVAGFPIPVSLNGDDLPRPDAIGNTDLVQVSSGLVSPEVLRGHGINRFYLQGLPIQENCSSVSSRWSSFDKKNVMHLDPTQFHGRMPDRNCLLEPQESGRRITASIHAAITEYLTRRASEMTPQEFVHTYADLALERGMLDLLNSISFVPARWLGKFEEAPILSGATTDSPIGYREIPTVVSREEIERVGIFSVDDESEDLRSCLAAYSRSAFVPGRYLRDQHWLSDATIDVDSDDFDVVPGNVLGTGEIDVDGYSITVHLCESLHLESSVEHPTLAGSIPVDACYHDGQLFITPNASFSNALKQISNFECDERFDHHAYDNAFNDLSALIKSIQHNDPALLLKSYLDSGIRVATPAQLRGRTFTVTFQDDGIYSVLPAAA